ncbi:uncharacterized protein LOC134654287 [Cydia amplana]|uniref:uncharacterized protein LOC134654287 n=1 Tax=Cydia amplana TaxID=1869771 RepID=UPI002FE657DA
MVFYENLNNQFRRSFIELHYKWCSFLFKDPIFGAAIRRQISFDRCPVPPATYHLYNLTAAAEHLPRLPFSKGRIYVNLKTKSNTIFSGYCEMELKKKKPIKH